MEEPRLVQLIPTWSVARLRQALTRGADALDEDGREVVTAELLSRGEDVPPDPNTSGLAETIKAWTPEELRAAYLEPVGVYDWRQRFAIEAEIARRQVELDVRVVPVVEPWRATVSHSISAGMTAISKQTGSLLGRTFLLGFLQVVLMVLVGAVAFGAGGLTSLWLPIYFVAAAALIVSFSYGLVRDGLSIQRGLPLIKRKADRPARQATWLIWGLLWLALLGCMVVLGAITPWLLIPGALLWGLALGSAVVCQLFVSERGLTPLAALLALRGLVAARPGHLLWMSVCWTSVWGLFFFLPMLIPFCGGCLALLTGLILVPLTATGWAHAYVALSGGFPDPGAPPPAWSFPGQALPRWLLPLCCLLLTTSLWTISGGAVLVTDVTQGISLTHTALFGWAPIAAFGGIAVLPVLITLALLARARRIGSGIVLDEEGLRLDVTDRWAGRRIAWERVRGFRLSGQGVRFLLRRRPWSIWTGPLVSVHEYEAHELVAQLESWNVRRDGA